MIRDPDPIFRFRITLQGIEPEIWRVIDVPEPSDFWALHTAIQDAMGWLNNPWHVFAGPGETSADLPMIGTPVENRPGDVHESWHTSIWELFFEPGDDLDYLYDFDDSWIHRVTLIDILDPEPATEYPRLVDGARACPPEECGGVSGYYRLLETLSDPGHADYGEKLAWLADHPGAYHPYDPDTFDPSEIVFSDPEERAVRTFGEGYRR